MDPLSIFASLFKPAVDLIDELHVSQEELLPLKIELAKVHNELSLKILEYEYKLLEVQASVINTEATGHSWLQRNWRPITMMTFLALIILNAFGLLSIPLNDTAYTLLGFGLTGYTVGRTAEKIVPNLIKKAMSK